MGSKNSAVSSPCVGLCELNDDSICTGCYRAIEEITGWGMLDNTEKSDIIERVQKRKETLAKKPK